MGLFAIYLATTAHFSGLMAKFADAADEWKYCQVNSNIFFPNCRGLSGSEWVSCRLKVCLMALLMFELIRILSVCLFILTYVVLLSRTYLFLEVSFLQWILSGIYGQSVSFETRRSTGRHFDGAVLHCLLPGAMRGLSQCIVSLRFKHVTLCTHSQSDFLSFTMII